MAKRFKMPTDLEFTEMWRPRPGFIGPSMPPMIAWQRNGEPKSAWEIAAGARHRPIAENLFEWARAES